MTPRPALQLQHMNKLIGTLALALLAGFAVNATAQDENLPNVNSALSVQKSVNGLFSVAVEPGLKPMRLNKLHYWNLRLSDADNKLVSGAKIRVDGGMPGHGHGLPTSPRVLAGDKPGEYILKGLRFNMGGVWQLKLDIDDGERKDLLEFRFVVTDSTGN